MTIGDLVNNAEALLVHAASSGIDVEDSVRQSVLVAASKAPPEWTQAELGNLLVVYALLGACAYSARRYEGQLKARTFTGAEKPWVRIMIACIDGVVVGLFAKLNATPEASLPPLAMAFLVGYGADVFFIFLDGVLQTFWKPSRNRYTVIAAPVQGDVDGMRKASHDAGSIADCGFRPRRVTKTVVRADPAPMGIGNAHCYHRRTPPQLRPDGPTLRACARGSTARALRYRGCLRAPARGRARNWLRTGQRLAPAARARVPDPRSGARREPGGV